jgi:hypothetical protein
LNFGVNIYGVTNPKGIHVFLKRRLFYQLEQFLAHDSYLQKKRGQKAMIFKAPISWRSIGYLERPKRVFPGKS